MFEDETERTSPDTTPSEDKTHWSLLNPAFALDLTEKTWSIDCLILIPCPNTPETKDVNSVVELNEVIALLDKLAPRAEPLGLFPAGVPTF